NLLYDLIYISASTNKTYMPHNISLMYKSLDLSLNWMLKPNDNIDLETVFGDQYCIENVMETGIGKVKEIVCNRLPEGEVIFLPSSEYLSRIVFNIKGEFGACIFNPKSILKCVYDSKTD